MNHQKEGLADVIPGSMPCVDVVVLVHNGRNNISDCLRSALNLKWPCVKVVVLDNASTDGSAEYVRRNYPNVKLIMNERNLGYTGGNNIGIKHSSGKYVLILNDDTEIHEGYLESAVSVMERDDRLAACSGKILYFHDRNRIQSAGDNIDFLGNNRTIGSDEIDDGRYDRPRESFFTSGMCMLLRRSALEKVGYFDEDFFIFYDEVDLCWRLRLAGYRCLYIPSAIVYHKGGATIKRANASIEVMKFVAYYRTRNQLRSVIKNYEARHVLIISISLLLLWFVYTVGLMIGGRGKVVPSMVGALWWNVVNLKNTLAERRRIQQLRRISDRDIMALMYPPSITINILVELAKKLVKRS